MTKIDGVSIYKVFDDVGNNDKIKILNNIFTELNKLHSIKKSVDNPFLLNDVIMEAHTKINNRYNEIEDFIKSFGKNIVKVNGLNLRSKHHRNILTDLFLRIEKYYSNHGEYSLIHGDLQQSNSMIDKNYKITIIDPRGYFGHTNFYGLPDYDIAKVLYSLSGYDKFNYSNSFYINSLTDEEIIFDIPKPNTHGISDYINQHFHNIHWLWLSVIWIGLAAYIKNNPIKSLAAFYHGLFLATKVLDDDLTFY
jgi:thiamine kinase-like enzyme